MLAVKTSGRGKPRRSELRGRWSGPRAQLQGWPLHRLSHQGLGGREGGAPGCRDRGRRCSLARKAGRLPSEALPAPDSARPVCCCPQCPRKDRVPAAAGTHARTPELHCLVRFYLVEKQVTFLDTWETCVFLHTQFVNPLPHRGAELGSVLRQGQLSPLPMTPGWPLDGSALVKL